MKYLKNYGPLLLFCLILATVRQNNFVSAETEEDQALKALTAMSGVNFTGPIAPTLAVSLLTIGLANTVLSQGDTLDSNKTALKDFSNLQAKLSAQLANIKNQVSEFPTGLNEAIEKNAYFKKMQNNLDELSISVTDNLRLILNPNITGPIRTKSVDAMLNGFSNFRKNLRSFIGKYINPTGVATLSAENDLFYDFMLKMNEDAVEEGDDCASESVHTKLFKTYMFLHKTLLDAYAMVISAHVIQYQIELKESNRTHVPEEQKVSLNLLENYRQDMKVFLEKTQLSLNKASRDVRNCGIFDIFKRGVTYDLVSFAHIVPKFRDFNHEETEEGFLSMFRSPTFQCFHRDSDVKNIEWEIEKCLYVDLKKPSKVTAFVNPNNSEWPYVYITNDPTVGAVQTFGNASTDLTGLIKREYRQTVLCVTKFCEGYKKKVVGVSTELGKADEGYVITGVRFGIRNNIIYIDIRQGKLLNDLTVDPDSLIWLETPPSKKILYLDAYIRKFELGDVEVQGNDYLRSIKFQMKDWTEGIIGLSVNGQTSSAKNYAISKEINLSGCQGAEKLGPDVKNLVSKPPVLTKPYHVSLQATDFEKDLGARTIPYFDLRNVETNPAAPISGIGLYHQTVRGSGGFISLKLKQVNLSKFVDYDLVEKTMNATISI